MEDKSIIADEELNSFLEKYAGWNIDDIWLVKDFMFEKFSEFNLFLRHLTTVIVKQGHHPDVDIRPSEKRVTIRTSTHSTGGLTKADIDLAIALEDH